MGPWKVRQMLANTTFYHSEKTWNIGTETHCVHRIVGILRIHTGILEHVLCTSCKWCRNRLKQLWGASTLYREVTTSCLYSKQKVLWVVLIITVGNLESNYKKLHFNGCQSGKISTVLSKSVSSPSWTSIDESPTSTLPVSSLIQGYFKPVLIHLQSEV